MVALISVIIPSYNNGKYVSESIESIIAQSYPDVEIILVDDGSTDDTRECVAPYIDRIHYIHQNNKGLSGARNTGYAVSTGEYILFLDSDDLLHPNALELLAQILNHSPDNGLVYCAWQQIDTDDKTILGEVHPRRAGKVVKPLLLREFFFFSSSTLIRREVLKQVGGFDETLPWGDDADMWLRIGLAGWSFGYLDVPVLQYRVHVNSMTANVTDYQIEGWQASLRKFFTYPDLPLEIRDLEKQAYAVLYFETAGRYFRVRDFEAGQRSIASALHINGVPDKEWFLNWLAGTALDPRTPEPQNFISQVFDHLPPEGKMLNKLRRSAHGRYHTAAMFAAYDSRNLSSVRQHILPALWKGPTNLTNRGFMKIVLHSMLGND